MGSQGKSFRVACGCAEFSIEASNIADEIQCIDIDKLDYRLR